MIDSNRLDYVYVIRRSVDRAVKIGYTRDPQRRYRQLRSTYGPVPLIALMRGSMADERRLHDRLRADSLDNEWFRSTPAVEEVVQKIIDLHGPPDLENTVSSVQTALRIPIDLWEDVLALEKIARRRRGWLSHSDVIRRAFVLGLEVMEQSP